MPELDDADKAVLIALLKATIAADRFPMSPRIRRLQRSWRSSIRQAPRPQPLPPPKPPGERSMALARKRRK